MATTADISIIGGPSIYLVRAVSDAGRAWIDENINVNDETLTFGPHGHALDVGGIVVEHRYINDIMQGAVHDGLKLERYA